MFDLHQSYPDTANRLKRAEGHLRKIIRRLYTCQRIGDPESIYLPAHSQE